MDMLNIVAWLVIGAVAGLIAAFVTRRETLLGYLTDIVIGLIGGFIGGFILSGIKVSVAAELVGINLVSALIALIGAVILLAILEFFRESPQ